MDTTPPAAMPEYLTTKELAQLLRIKERKVYELAAAGEVPCSKVTGKLLFPERAVRAWLEHARSGPRADTAARPAVFLGSHDPLLEWALRESRSGLATFFDGSLDGLERFAAREGVATGLHLHDAGAGDWNVPAVARRCGDEPAVLVAWATRRRGLIVRAADRGRIRSIADLAGRRIAARQPESGSQALFARLCREAGTAAEDFAPAAVARSEADAALAVAEGTADAAFGLEALAAQFGLAFVPVTDERFDLLVDRRAWFEPPMQRLLAFCRSEPFLGRARALAGYDVSALGAVRWNGA
ncbi:MAG TPA: helix-turn-helix transcriptional regulator [Thermohalobaculum sp.]|nr:helix-turn-helix transcriptional regulator [Thermohalobaculum sp.]